MRIASMTHPDRPLYKDGNAPATLWQLSSTVLHPIPVKTIVFFLITSIVLSSTSAKAQDNTETQSDYYIGASAFISLLPLPLNLSIDALKYSGKAYHGVTVGLTTFIGSNSYPDYGGHITYTRLALKSRGYFESKIGIAYNKNFTDYWINSDILPILSIGYRFQKTDGRWFFRIALSPGLIGVGFGAKLN